MIQRRLGLEEKRDQSASMTQANFNESDDTMQKRQLRCIWHVLPEKMPLQGETFLSPPFFFQLFIGRVSKIKIFFSDLLYHLNEEQAKQLMQAFEPLAVVPPC
ncbi:hypothetical protein PHYPSEUDO_015219 [Phytophthora pseudosyringae]|uniref:Uncharacterized protein n=1 Tax=Phytophthora pseudosyringae TaxID=221518 RepID=A0A8T1W0D0_9STRA|nr:hypothetical protein PHYPSEUDO_015219 [Phytophthora pseudosyringae]